VDHRGILKKISVVIPIYNEAASLPELLFRVCQTCQPYEPYEVVCVDDGSTDQSFETLQHLKSRYPQIVIIKFLKNAGQSAALAAGLKFAQGDIMVTLDADLQNPPEAIPLLLNNMDGVDAVIGWRAGRRDSFVTRWGSWVANAVRRIILRDSFHDNGCTLKAFRRECVSDLMMFEKMVVFLPNLIAMAGYQVREIVVPHEPRKHGKSKYKKFSLSGIQAFFDVLFVRGYKKRMLVYEIEKVIS